MPLQTSGPISLFALQNEFGGNNPIGLGEYHRGGGIVNASTAAGTGSFQTYPLVPAAPAAIPVSPSSIQLSHFYGTQSVIVGNIGYLVTAPANNDLTSDFIDIALPAGVDLIRIFLMGAGGGIGGKDNGDGGQGGGGSVISGTINTAWAGPINVQRTLRFFIGRGGQPGPSHATGDSWNTPAPPGGHGYGMFGIKSTAWSSWFSTYAVTHDMAGGTYLANARTAARMIFFPTTGNYRFEFLADNKLSIGYYGANIADTSGLNAQGVNSEGTYSRTTPLHRDVIGIVAGYHKIKFTFTNNGSIGAYAVRIVNTATNAVIWTTRDEYGGYRATPAGGSGGYAGSHRWSGYGGGGGSATMLSIINGYGQEYFVALAGGGGGGGGGGAVVTVLPNVSQAGNWANQGWSTASFSPGRIAGGDGEYLGRRNNNAGDSGVASADGGGGGGGGGGVINSRIYVNVTDFNWQYSGFGGLTRRGPVTNFDAWADGGESGKSAITSAATRYADVHHLVTTTRYPNFPTAVPGLPTWIRDQFGSYGKGGHSAEYSGIGYNGAAYVDWGTTPVAPTTINTSPIRASIIPYTSLTGVSTSDPTRWFTTVSGPKTVVLDAWGGGGNPGSEYIYTWSNNTGAATIGSPFSYRTTVTLPSSGSGTIQCSVSDGVSTATAFWTWEIYADPVYVPPDNISCFPAGAMVLMGDGTERAIETLKAGDMVMSTNGPTQVLQMDTPHLGPRRLYSFEDGHSWSEEHPHWTRDATGAQWWWTADIDSWLAEVAVGAVVGLKDNSSMRIGAGFEFAHIDGWKNNTPIVSIAPADTQLYFPVTNGAPIIVNGYLVTGGTNENNFDYKAIDWDKARTQIFKFSSVAPISNMASDVKPFPIDWAPPPIDWPLEVVPELPEPSQDLPQDLPQELPPAMPLDTPEN